MVVEKPICKYYRVLPLKCGIQVKRQKHNTFVSSSSLTTAFRYMQGFKCNVTGASSAAAPLAKAQVPTFCENEPEQCVKGAKQMLAWHQATGNNIETAQWVTPNYNLKCGWAEGAQTDIFETRSAPSAPSTVISAFSTSIVAAASSTQSLLVTPSPTVVTGGVKSSSTLVTLVSSTTSQVTTPTSSAGEIVSYASSKVGCTASAVVAPSTSASTAVPTKSCSRRRPWRKC